MEYGLWNLHGGFWTGNNPCAGNDRTLYNSVNASGGNVFHGCPETVPFPNMATAPPCRSTYRGQPEYVAMKPAGTPARPPSDTVPVLPPRAPSVSENVEVMPSLQNEILTEHNSQDQGSGNSNIMPMSIAQSSNNLAPVMMPETSTNHSNKKVKMPKSSRKRNENAKTGNLLPPVPLPYLNQQYNNPMYSMMFGRPSMKRPDTTSDESEDDDDDENANDADNYSNASSATGNQSPTRTGMSRPGFECGQCDLVADTRPALKKHIGICHPGPQPDSNLTHALKLPGICPMPSCHFRSLSAEEMEGHIARHVADGYQRQPSLSKKQRSSAISLQRVRYEREEYRCQMCSYTCTIEKAFYKHLKLHSMGMNVPAVKISCVICGKDRPTEVEMNKHMRKHRDNRYFCCDVCIFRTVQLKKLIQHRRMHTGEKPHLCPHCAYRSARRDNLRSHVRRVHKKDNLFCDTFSPRGLLMSPSSPGRQQQ